MPRHTVTIKDERWNITALLFGTYLDGPTNENHMISIHPLEGPFEKVKRAQEQLSYLSTEIAAILNSGAYTVAGRHDFNPKRDRQRYVFHSVGPRIPPRISVLSGEIVHHLFSVFDHIVWALAINSGSPYHSNIGFPVKATPEKFNAAVDGGMLKGVPSRAIPLIESFQPYRSPDPQNAVTRVLHDLDNTDKHRLLVTAVHMFWPGQEIRFVGEFTSDVNLYLADPPEVGPFHRGVENGKEIFWLSYAASAHPQWQIENDFSPQIAFEKFGSGERVPIIPVLEQLCDTVMRVIGEFAQFF